MSEYFPELEHDVHAPKRVRVSHSEDLAPFSAVVAENRMLYPDPNDPDPAYNCSSLVSRSLTISQAASMRKKFKAVGANVTTRVVGQMNGKDVIGLWIFPNWDYVPEDSEDSETP